MGNLVHSMHSEGAIKSIIVPNGVRARCSNLLGESDLVNRCSHKDNIYAYQYSS